MSTRKLKNVTLRDFRDFLSKCGCKCIRTEGGHEIWSRKDLTRPIVVQTHENPVPEFILRNALRDLSLSRKDFFEILFEEKIEKSYSDDKTYTKISKEDVEKMK